MHFIRLRTIPVRARSGFSAVYANVSSAAVSVAATPGTATSGTATDGIAGNAADGDFSVACDA